MTSVRKERLSFSVSGPNREGVYNGLDKALRAYFGVGGGADLDTYVYNLKIKISGVESVEEYAGSGTPVVQEITQFYGEATADVF